MSDLNICFDGEICGDLGYCQECPVRKNTEPKPAIHKFKEYRPALSSRWIGKALVICTVAAMCIVLAFAVHTCC